LLGRRTQTLLPTRADLLQSQSVDPQAVVLDILHRRSEAKRFYDKHAGKPHMPMDVGSRVYVKPPPHHHGTPWTEGEIIACADRNYTIQTPNRVVSRNRVHIRPVQPLLGTTEQASVSQTAVSTPPEQPPPLECLPDNSEDHQETELRSNDLEKPTSCHSAPAEEYKTRSGRLSKRPQVLDL